MGMTATMLETCRACARRMRGGMARQWARWACLISTHPCRAARDNTRTSTMTGKTSAPGSTKETNAASALEAPLEVGHPWRHIALGLHKRRWRQGCQAEEGKRTLGGKQSEAFGPRQGSNRSSRLQWQLDLLLKNLEWQGEAFKQKYQSPKKKKHR